MKTLNIAVAISSTRQDTPKLDNRLIEQIRQVHPGIKVTDASPLAAREQRGDTEAKEKLDALLAETDIVVGFVPPHNILKRAPNLKWIQLMSAGADGVYRRFVLPAMPGWQMILVIG